MRLGDGRATSCCPNPIVAASGTFGYGDEVARLCPPDRLGAVTVKSLAAFEWSGNPAPRLAPVGGGGMLNSVGLQGPGVEHWIEHGLPELRALGARVFASLWGRTVDDFAVAAKMLAPAVARSRRGRGQRQLSRTSRTARGCSRTRRRAPPRCVRAVRDADLGLPLFAKLSPNTFEIVDVAGAALDARRDRAHARQHAARLRHRRDAPPAAARRRRRRAVGSAAQAGRAARGARRRARVPRARRSSAPAASASGRTSSRCSWPARPRSGSGP